MGFEQAATSASQTTARSAAVSGKIHGGPNPIQQADVTLWETWTYGISGAATGRTALSANSGYGAKAYVIGSATTNSLGLWNIGSFNCDSGEYVYVTATGGKTASNSANNNEVLIAPLGACSALPAAVHTDISELSTLAVAYTLGSFLTEDSSYLGAGQQRVYIGAPAANNASAASCTSTGAAMTCAARGLGDAFDAALSLVPSTNYVTTAQTALSANTVPTDPSGNVPNATGAIPAALLNTLANALQGCVNSSGGAPPDTSACGQLFSATTVGSSVPTDTLQATLNIAKYPTNSVGAIYALALPVSAFTPTLTAVPNDFSLAVTYTGSDAVNTTSFQGPASVVFGPGGAAIVGMYTKVEPNVYLQLAGLSSNMQQFAVNHSPPGFFPLAVDAAGNVYLSGTGGLSRMDSSTLVSKAVLPIPVSSTPQYLAIDRNNNVYVDVFDPGYPIYTAGPTATSLSGMGTVSTSPLVVGTGSQGSGSLNFDASENLWLAFNSSSAGTLGEKFSSGGGCTLPTFCSAADIQSTATQTQFAGPILTSDGSAWFYTANTPTLYQVSAAGTNVAAISAPGVNNLGLGLADGAGTLFFPSYSPAAQLVSFVPSTQSWTSLQPCTLVVTSSSTQSTTCSDAMYAVITLNVDASGVVWLPDYYGNKMIKLFGVAAPVWPYAGYNHPGEMPH